MHKELTTKLIEVIFKDSHVNLVESHILAERIVKYLEQTKIIKKDYNG